MSKPKTNTNTVKQPKIFNAEELQRLQDQAVESYKLRPGVDVFVLRELYARQAFKLFAQKLSEGYVHAYDHPHMENPYIIPMYKSQEEMEAEYETVREEVKAKYKAEIEASVQLAKDTLIQQRRDYLAKQEEEKKKKEETALQDRLEKEAAELFDKYLPE